MERNECIFTTGVYGLAGFKKLLKSCKMCFKKLTKSPTAMDKTASEIENLPQKYI